MRLFERRQSWRLRKGFFKKLLLVNFTTIFLLALCVNSNAKGISQQVSLSEKDASLEKVFKQIQKQTGYTFVYTESVLKKGKNVSVKVKNADVLQVLEACFKDQVITYTILNKMVVIKEKEKKSFLPSNLNLPHPLPLT
jgi:type II secretory pathway component GspD/PulD (secretin)